MTRNYPREPRGTLGKAQKGVLRAMLEKDGVWYPNCGWTWDTVSGTTRIMESLFRRDLVDRTVDGSGRVTYRVNKRGENLRQIVSDR